MVTAKSAGFGLIILMIVLVSCTPIVIDETENASVGTVFINEIMAANTYSGIDSYFNNYCDWIELYNAGDRVIDLSSHFLTDNFNNPQKWQIPDGTVIGPGEYLVFWADGEDIYDHTNFKLSREGEEVGLFNSVGATVDYVIFGPQEPDVSFGRKPDGSGGFFYFSQPTLLAANTATGIKEKRFAPVTRASIPGGFYNGAQVVELMSDSPSALFRYTLDGTIPNEDSTLYTGPIPMETTTVLQARSFESNALQGPVLTQTYFIDETITLPVVSIVTDPVNFFDETIGIYIKGPGALPEAPYYGANFWHEWERAINIEYFTPGSTALLNVRTGVKIYGGDSKGNAQKSLALYARNKYGSPIFDNKFFDSREGVSYKRLGLRNSGQDWASTLFRDALHQTLVKDRMDLDLQSYTPAVLFLNGSYWGIHNIREKIDEEYIEANYNLLPDGIDFLYHFDGKIRASRGSNEHYDALMEFMKTNDMSLPENYQYIKTQMDVDQYMNYQIIQHYIANVAWLAENTKLWRPRTGTGRWRWILFDTDFGFGIYTSYHKDMMKHCTAENGPNWPNPPWSTFLFRKMVENPQFNAEFIQRFAAHLDTSFAAERVLQLIEEIKTRIEGEMPRTMEKWGGTLDEMMNLYFPSTLAQWESSIDVMRKFAERRPIYVRQHLNDFYGLDGTVQLTVNIVIPEGGQVLINGVEINAASFKGDFFKGIPLQMEAIANPGFRFVQWSGPTGLNREQGSTEVTLTGDSVITVIFTQL